MLSHFIGLLNTKGFSAIKGIAFPDTFPTGVDREQWCFYNSIGVTTENGL